MIEWWPVLLGWPLVLIALTLSTLGILQMRPSYLYTAMVLILPISLYLAGAPIFPFAALLAPLALLAAGRAIRQKKTRLALAITLPVILLFGWLAVLVLRQPGSQY